MAPKRFVYIIRSDRDRRRYYVGLTADLQSRLASHNAGESPHTRRFTPWQIVVAIAFSGEHEAAAFERYLKSAAGTAFLKQHLLPPARE